jgi:hypothetical protein
MSIYLYLLDSTSYPVSKRPVRIMPEVRDFGYSTRIWKYAKTKGRVHGIKGKFTAIF